ncbi:MAG: hypothetical protein ACRBBN_15665 [Methyloligellaceae bacterium]
MSFNFKPLISTVILLILATSSGWASPLPDRAKALYQSHEQKCIKKGWTKMRVTVSGHERKILFKMPRQNVKGAVIVLHGGSGSYSNFCSGIWIGKPMVQFSELALQEAFAVFSLDSGWNSFTDENGNLCGKRWNSFGQNNKANRDLDFIKAVATKHIPLKLPVSARRNIFMSGISNGGYMTILSSVYLSKWITAFAPVSAGNPFSTRIDCKRRFADRPMAPGRFFHTSGNMINSNDACKDNHIKLLPKRNSGIAFKQFHHKGDSLVDLSCMNEAQHFLVKNGFKDRGAYIASDNGGKRLWKHFWLGRYNEGIISFFKERLR